MSSSRAVSSLLAAFRRLPRGVLMLGTLLLILIALLWPEGSEDVAWDGLATWAGIVTVVLLLVALHLRVPSRLQAARSRQIRERLDRAAAQLRSDRLDLRLAAIHALGEIARERAESHWSAMETLSAFVRENAGWGGDDERPPEEPTRGPPTVRSDIEAALEAIGGRRWLSEEREWGVWLELANTNLRGAALVDAHLERADLHDAHLEYAELWRAHLESANLAGAHLEDANLSQVHLELANLEKAHLAGANLQFGSLQGANLRGADLTGVRLTLAHLEGADLSNATGLTRTQLRGAYRDRGTKLPDYIGDPS